MSTQYQSTLCDPAQVYELTPTILFNPGQTHPTRCESASFYAISGGNDRKTPTRRILAQFFKRRPLVQVSCLLKKTGRPVQSVRLPSDRPTVHTGRASQPRAVLGFRSSPVLLKSPPRLCSRRKKRLAGAESAGNEKWDAPKKNYPGVCL